MAWSAGRAHGVRGVRGVRGVLAVVVSCALAWGAAGCAGASASGGGSVSPPATAAAPPSPRPPPAPSPTPTAREQRDITGLVDVGGGRKIYTECRGKGSPTVILIAGKGNGVEDWRSVLDPADPIHQAPGDDLPWRTTGLHLSDDSVFTRVSRFTRVCAYDRPGIRVGPGTTTPRPQPHTLDLAADDLNALLTALGEPGPYVLVAHSYGGLIATLYARTHPRNVAGLVMVDTVTELMADVISPGALRNWDATNARTSPQVREGVHIIDAFRRINAAPPMPRVPAVVLSADKPWRLDLLPPEERKGERVAFKDSLTALDRLSKALHAEKHITRTNSGHDIYLYSPQLVTDAIRTVVDDVR
ncbi:alpha/beta fold hydrolase [Streptomyces sp. NPDC048603]|uniref:alpha/beta fold hydrolase n=1 Tax=Streptomyces sp. NPDC048603 TaxID=3365577 RepID=UPI003718747E